MSQPTILIAVPTFENICPETFKSIYGLQSNNYILRFDYVKGYDCAKARNEIVRRAREQKFDYILMVDSDIIVPSDAIKLLMEDPGDIRTAVYPRKNTATGDTEMFKDDDFNYVHRYTFPEINDILENGENRIKIKGCGLGCVLIKTSIFDALPFPWFKYVTYDNGEVLSEDLYFCSMVNYVGLKVEADLRVRCKHLVRWFQES